MQNLSTILLTEKQLSERLSLSTRTLQYQRLVGKGIPFIKIGRAVRYDWDEVQRFLQNNRRISTSQYSQSE